MGGFEGPKFEESSDKIKKPEADELAKEKTEKSPEAKIKELLIKKQTSYQEEINKCRDVKAAEAKAQSIAGDIIKLLSGLDLLKGLKDGNTVIKEYLNFAEEPIGDTQYTRIFDFVIDKKGDDITISLT